MVAFNQILFRSSSSLDDYDHCVQQCFIITCKKESKVLICECLDLCKVFLDRVYIFTPQMRRTHGNLDALPKQI